MKPNEADGKTSRSSRSKPPKDNRTLIIAFDTASNDTGVAIKFDDGSPVKDGTYLTYGEIAESSEKIETRCGSLHVRVCALLDRYLRDADEKRYKVVIVMEQARQGQFRNVYAALRAAQSAIWCAAFERDLPIRYVAPVQIRAALNLKTGASKEEIADEVKKLFSLPKELSDNITDAIGIAEAFSRGWKMKRVVKKIERRKTT